MIYTVDRIEGSFAVLVDEECRSSDVGLSELPEVKEGDVLEKTGEGYQLRPELTKSRRERLAGRTRSMFED